MSSQDTNSGIPLSHGPDATGYKLLELPSEVLELIESQHPPTLTLHPSPGAALLKTPSKTYSLRQKNTSNALILLSPHTLDPQPPSASDEAGSSSSGLSGPPATTGLTAITTLHGTIELVPEADEAATAAGAAGTGAAAAPKAKGKWHEKFGRGR